MSLAPGVLTLVACLTACVSYIGDITKTALVLLLLPTALVVGLVGIRMRGRTVIGLPLIGVLSWLGAEVVNFASGELQGPAARTTAVAAICTGSAVLMAASRVPALFLLPLGGIVAGALAYGAGGHVQVVAIATAGLGACALASIERDRRAMVGRRRATGSLLLVVLLVGLVAASAVLFQGRHDTRAAQAPLRQNYEQPIVAPWFVSLPQPVVSTPAATGERATVTPIVQPPNRNPRLLRWLLLALAGFASMLFLLAGRLALASWSWRRYFRTIDRSYAGTVGAWLWAMAHLQRVELAPPPASSPDLLASGRLEGVDEELQDMVQRLAAVVAPEAFGGLGPEEPERASDSRALARQLAHEAWSSAGLLRRCRGHWRFAPRLIASAGPRTNA